MSSVASAAAEAARKRLQMEEEMLEFKAECQKELNTKKSLLLKKAIKDGLDVAALGFLSPPSPDMSGTAAALVN